ncbi:MAG TPA: hypothetical protein VF169_18210 [Albitalea sp.]|uniref:hypothetical protein n=1 Tax=Piscinibacter sp. TaxID=1903157 RepID=UPI002ED583B6
MLVDVVCLRREGVKLQPEEIRAATPVRGYLTIDTVNLGPPVPEAPCQRKNVARLWSAADSCPVDGMECARISRVGGDALVLVGVETRPGELEEIGHPQAWYCKVVLDSEEESRYDSVRDTGPDTLPSR